MNFTHVTCFVIAYLLLYFYIFIGCKDTTSNNPNTGPQWLVYNTSNSSLIDNYINCLYADAQGRIWAATDSGVSSYSYGSWNSIRNELSFRITLKDYPYYRYVSSVSSIVQGFDQSIWFGLKGGGIVKYKPTSAIEVWRRYQARADNLPDDNILGLTTDLIQKEIWCATLFGVGRFIPGNNETGVWTVYTTKNSSLLTNQTRSIALNVNDNSIWVGTHNQGTTYFDNNGYWQTAISLPPSENYPIVSIAFDLRKYAWFGKWNGVSCLNTKTGEWVSHYTWQSTNGKLPSGYVNAVLTDLQTTRWFGTNYGLVRLHDTTWTMFNRQNSPLPSDTVTALVYDVKGNLWIGTAQGVAVYNEKGTR